MLPLANRTLNFKLQTPDNETLGAWFILSEPYYRSLPAIPTEVAKHIVPALKERPVVLFFHGNAATRAFSARIQHYQGFSTRLGANVLAIDYRGFADSTGKPSETGLVCDARSAFDWLVAQGKKPEDILIVGHSLGTGVSGQLAAQLAAENIKPRGIVLLSVSIEFHLPKPILIFLKPFTSIHEVLETYNMFGFIPLMKPISIIPGAAGELYIEGIITDYQPGRLDVVKMAVVHRFDTLKAVPVITFPLTLLLKASG